MLCWNITIVGIYYGSDTCVRSRALKFPKISETRQSHLRLSWAATSLSSKLYICAASEEIFNLKYIFMLQQREKWTFNFCHFSVRMLYVHDFVIVSCCSFWFKKYNFQFAYFQQREAQILCILVFSLLIRSLWVVLRLFVICGSFFLPRTETEAFSLFEKFLVYF